MHKSKSNEQFLEELYIRHYDLVYRLIRRQLHSYRLDISSADDILQDVFITAAVNISTLRAHPNPAGWLCKTAVNLLCNHSHSHTAQQKHLVHTLDLHGSVETLPAVDVQISLEQTLSPEDYALVHAYCIEKRPTEEICHEYGLSPSALRVRVFRIRKILLDSFIFFVTIALRRHI